MWVYPSTAGGDRRTRGARPRAPGSRVSRRRRPGRDRSADRARARSPPAPPPAPAAPRRAGTGAGGAARRRRASPSARGPGSPVATRAPAAMVRRTVMWWNSSRPGGTPAIPGRSRMPPSQYGRRSIHTGWNIPGTAHEARIAVARSPRASTSVRRREDVEHADPDRDPARGELVERQDLAQQRDRTSCPPAARPRARDPRSRRAAARRAPARARPARAPRAHAPATSAPALEPETCVGRRPRATSADSIPVCAKNEKNPLDIASPNGARASHSPRVVVIATDDSRDHVL